VELGLLAELRSVHTSLHLDILALRIYDLSAACISVLFI
jgi:hypothetical protein